MNIGEGERSRRRRFVQQSIKKILDRIVGFAGLVAAFPIMLILGMLVKLESRGPVFFRQRRVGKNGRLFTLLKLRTMRIDAEPYAVAPKHATDPRITRVGRFLRSRGLDELPQLWSVLKGDMSLIGPRPEMPFIAEQYTDQELERTNVLPGITGYWQVAARKGKPIHADLELDLYYVRNWSLKLDLWILWQTAKLLCGFNTLGQAFPGHTEKRPAETVETASVSA